MVNIKQRGCLVVLVYVFTGFVDLREYSEGVGLYLSVGGKGGGLNVLFTSSTVIN